MNQQSRSEYRKVNSRPRDWKLIGMSVFILAIIGWIIIVNLPPSESYLKKDARNTISQKIGDHFPAGGEYDEKLDVNNLSEIYAVWGSIDYGDEEYMTYVVHYTKGGDKKSMILLDSNGDLIEEWHF